MFRPTMPDGVRGVVMVLAGLIASSMVAGCSQIDGLIGEPETEAQTATVAVLVPSDAGDDVTSGGVIAAVESAVSASTADLDDWTVSVEVVVAGEDDTATVEALEALLDDDLIAVVGGLEPSTVRAAQPVLDARDVIFVSPADTRIEHTRGADATAPLRPYASYFRTAVTDADPVTEAMRYAAAVHGVDDVTVLDTEGGEEPVRGADAANAAGLEVVAPRQGDDDAEQIPLTGPVSGASDLNARVDAAAATTANGIFLAAHPSRVAGILERLAVAGSDAVMFGGSAFGDDTPPESGEFDGLLLRGRAPELPTTMNATPDGLDAALDGAGPGRYGAAAFDAGTVVGSVLSACLPSAASASDARTGCLGEMDQTRVTGLTGEVAFDEFGDRIGGTVTVETARDGAWVTAAGP